MRRFTMFAFATQIALSLSPPAQSASSLINDRRTFNALIANRTTVDFEGLAPNSGFQFISTPPGVTLSGANFTIDPVIGNGNLYVIGDDYYYSHNSVLSSQQATSGRYHVHVTLPGLYTAIAANFGVVDPGTGFPFRFNLSTGEVFTKRNIGGPTLDFVGFVSLTPFSSMTISIPRAGNAMNIDDFTFGQAVPEPSMLVIVLTGLSFWLGGVGAAANESR